MSCGTAGRSAGWPNKDAAIIQFGRELFERHTVSTDTYARALKIFGERDLVDLVDLMARQVADVTLLTAFDQQPARRRDGRCCRNDSQGGPEGSGLLRNQSQARRSERPTCRSACLQLDSSGSGLGSHMWLSAFRREGPTFSYRVATADSATTGLVSAPIPSMLHVAVSPGRIQRGSARSMLVPAGLPPAITSPALSVRMLEANAPTRRCCGSSGWYSSPASPARSATSCGACSSGP